MYVICNTNNKNNINRKRLNLHIMQFQILSRSFLQVFLTNLFLSTAINDFFLLKKKRLITIYFHQSGKLDKYFHLSYN